MFNVKTIAIFLFLTLCSTNSFGQAENSSNQNNQDVEFMLSDENLLLADIVVGDLILGNTIDIFQHEGGVLVPLGLVTEILEFPIEVDVDNKQASGWFLRENRTFYLDLNKNEVIIEGVKKDIGSRLALPYITDIYVDSSLFSEWFPIDMKFKFSDLVLEVTPRENLPFQQRLKREEIRSRNQRRQKGSEQFEVAKPDYKMFDYPFANITTGYNYDKNPSTDGRKHRSNYSAMLAGDLLKMNADMFLSGDSEDHITSLRFKAGRRDYEGNLLGPLGATEAYMGDVTTYQLPLVSPVDRGRGFNVTNQELQRPNQFDSTTFIGDSQPGWEVELYRNGELIDFLTVSDDGKYEFSDVSIFYGNNIFRIVSYGPQGQIEEKTETYNVDSSLLKKDEFTYQLSMDEKSKTVFRVDEKNTEPNHENKVRSVANFEYGLTENMTTSYGIARVPLDNLDTRTYQNISFKNSFNKLLTETNLSQDLDNGNWASQLTAVTKIKDINIKADNIYFSNFVSDQYTNLTEEPRKTLSELSLGGNISKLFPTGLNYRFLTAYETFEEQRRNLDFKNTISTSLFGLSLVNNLNFSNTKTDSTSLWNNNGSFTIRGRRKKTSIRFATNYTLKPDRRVSSVSLTTQHQLKDDLNIRLGVQKNLLDEKIATYSGTINKIFDKYRLSFNTNLDDDGNFAFGTNLSFALGRDQKNKKWHMSGKDYSSQGAASAQAFLDSNYNDKFDDGEEILENTRFSVNNNIFEPGDKSKSVFVTGLKPDLPTNVKIDISSFEDPYLKPTKLGYSVVARPGTVTPLVFPVIEVTEIDGTVYYQKNGEFLPIPRVTVELLDRKKGKVTTVQSEFDGFYIFYSVIPGDYIVQVSQKDVNRLKAKNILSEHLVIKKTTDIISGIDIFILTEDIDRSEAAPIPRVKIKELPPVIKEKE